MLSMSGLGSLTKVPQKGGAGHPCRRLQAVSLCCLHLHTFGAGSFKQSNCNARAHFVGAITVHDRPHPPLQLPPSRQQQTQTADSYFLFFFPPSPTTFTPRRAPFPTTSFLTTTVRHPPLPTDPAPWTTAGQCSYFSQSPFPMISPTRNTTKPRDSMSRRSRISARMVSWSSSHHSFSL